MRAWPLNTAVETSPPSSILQPSEQPQRRARHGRRYSHRQLPAQAQERVVLDGLLDVGRLRAIEYDTRLPPAHATCLVIGMRSDWQWGLVRATTPGLDSLAIRVPFMGDDPIVVFPDHTRQPVVCVLDVLYGVHQAACERLNGCRHESGLGLETNDPYAPWTRFTPLAAGAGWRWGGLIASTTERDVWHLLLQ
jgi:hypothetical protein